MSLPTPEELRSRVPSDADLDWITPELRSLAVRVQDLILDPRNARKHNSKNMDAIKASITQFQQRQPITVNSRTLIIEAGNGRIQAMRELGLEYVAATFHDDDSLTATGYAIADNRTAELASWDEDVLGELLLGLQFEGLELSGLGFDSNDLASICGDDSEKKQEFGPNDQSSDDAKSEDSKYTLKMDSPVYKITGERPELNTLFDRSRQESLVAAIHSSMGIPEDVAEFLMLASYRHTRFNYQRIAEYYAYAPKDIQKLMEDSALVIIDYNSAIERGYVQLSQRLTDLRLSESNTSAEGVDGEADDD